MRGWLVSEKGRDTAPLARDLGGDVVQLPQGRPRFRRLADRLVDGGNAGSRNGHLGKFPIGFEGDHKERRQTRDARRQMKNVTCELLLALVR
jgi:hypothetical protein